MKTVATLVRKISPRLRARFKARCAAENRSMQTTMELLLRLYVDRPDVLERK